MLSGDITVTFRLWRRPQVKPGGRYRVGDGRIEVDSVELVPFAFIDNTDVRRAGETDLESLRRRAAHAGRIHERNRPLSDRVPCHRIDAVHRRLSRPSGTLEHRHRASVPMDLADGIPRLRRTVRRLGREHMPRPPECSATSCAQADTTASCSRSRGQIWVVRSVCRWRDRARVRRCRGRD